MNGEIQWKAKWVSLVFLVNLFKDRRVVLWFVCVLLDTLCCVKVFLEKCLTKTPLLTRLNEPCPICPPTLSSYSLPSPLESALSCQP